MKYVVSRKLDNDQTTTEALNEPEVTSAISDSSKGIISVVFTSFDDRVSNGNLYLYDSNLSRIGNSAMFVLPDGNLSSQLLLDRTDLRGSMTAQVPFQQIYLAKGKTMDDVSTITVSLTDGLQFQNRTYWEYRCISKYVTLTRKE